MASDGESNVMGLTAGVYDDYCRWDAKLPVVPVATTIEHVSARDVLRAHYLVVDHFARLGAGGVGGVGPIDDEHFGLLVSAVGRQYPYFGECRWSGVFEFAATVFYAVATSHIFKDANKRTALLTVLYQLSNCDWVPSVQHREFERLAVDVASINETNWPGHKERKRFPRGPDGDVEYIASYLRRRTRKTDNRQRIITYKQLDRLLRRFGFFLNAPENNKIDICHDEQVVESRWLGLVKKQQTRRTRLGEIGFRGWTYQVPASEMKKARKMTGTSGTHVDSQTFFDGVDSIESLIPEYEGALRRLADK